MDVKTLWVGGEGGMERELVIQAGLSYRSIPAAGVHGVEMRKLPRNLFQMARGVVASRRLLKEFRPDVLFFTGGYVAGPMAFAGWHIPTLVFVPDIEPGLALQILSRFADRITVTSPDSKPFFKQDVFVTGYPLRPELEKWNRKKARAALHLTSRKPVLLVYGGSKGAQSLNRAVIVNLPKLLEFAEVIHITGKQDWEDTNHAVKVKELIKDLGKSYHRFPYLNEIGQALGAADLVVSRAGASSLGELPYFSVPAILVPYPHAWRYQKVNAEYLARNGAAVVLDDSSLNSSLLPTVKQLLENPRARERMSQAMGEHMRPHAAYEIAQHLVELAGEESL